MVYDVIIAGSGPAGSMAAFVCAKAGLEVLLIDKVRFPRNKPCGGALSVRSQQVLQSVGISLPPEIIDQVISGIEFMGPDLKPFVARTTQPLAKIVRRSLFDDYLARQAAAAGAQFIDNCPVVRLETSTDGVVCHTNQGKFSGQLLIGADGAASRVARITGLRGPEKSDEIGIALEVDVPVSDQVWNTFLNPSILVVWMLNIPYGYFWAFPRKMSLSLGLGGMATGFKNMRNLLKGIAQMFTTQKGLPSFALHGIRGHMLPLFKHQRPITSNRVLLTGDAAGFVDTFSGQGIYYALESGLLAAQAVINVIKQNQDPSKSLDQYSQLVQLRFGEELRCSYSVARFIHSRVHGFIQTGRRLKSFGKVIFDLASGNTDYYQIIHNPLRFSVSLFVHELQHRIHRRT